MSPVLAHSDAPPQDGRASLSAQSGNGAIITPCAASRRPWTIEEANDACFIVRDSTGQALAYDYFEDEPGRRSAAKLLTRDEARCLAANFAKLLVIFERHGCGTNARDRALNLFGALLDAVD
jgi:hypothetical protein